MLMKHFAATGAPPTIAFQFIHKNHEILTQPCASLVIYSVSVRFEHSTRLFADRRTLLPRAFVFPLVGAPSEMGACAELSERKVFIYRIASRRVSRCMLLIATSRGAALRGTRKSDSNVRLP